MMFRKLGILALVSFAIGVGSVATAATIYTTGDGTIVRDKPTETGSMIIATLKPDTMIETAKTVGAYTSVSVIVDGQVKTGYISTNQLQSGATDITQAPPTKAPAIEVPPSALGQSAEGSIEQAAPLTSRLDRPQISAADLVTFAEKGKLVARKSKSSSKAPQ